MGRDNRDPGTRATGQQQRASPRSASARKQVGYVGRAGAADAGRSGYGSESVRPYLRAQLRLKELLAGGPMAPKGDWGGKPARSNRARRGEGDD